MERREGVGASARWRATARPLGTAAAQVTARPAARSSTGWAQSVRLKRSLLGVPMTLPRLTLLRALRLIPFVIVADDT